MSYDFNAKDVLEMAVRIERNGADFYKKAADKVVKEEYKKMLLNLAKMEEEHEKTFLSIKNSLTEKEKKETVFDPEGQASFYLKALADTKVFADNDIDMSSIENILKGAIGAEKDSIVFYVGLKHWVPESMGKNRLETIIKEEIDHIRLLGEKLSSL